MEAAATFEATEYWRILFFLYEESFILAFEAWNF